MEKKKNSQALPWFALLLIAFSLIFITGEYLTITSIKNQLKVNRFLDSTYHQSSNPLNSTSLKPDSNNQYKIGQRDLDNFNDHIIYLTQKVEAEVRRVQETSQYDIDRINLALAIGIGLLTIIGGLLPIFVNYFSKEHLEKRIETLEALTKEVEGVAKKSNNLSDTAKKMAEETSGLMKNTKIQLEAADRDVKQISEVIPELTKRIDEVKNTSKKIPYIDLLVLQNAVAKLTSTDALKLNLGDERMKLMIAYLENLRLAISSFNDGDVHSFENYTKENLIYFQNVIAELKLALFLGPIRRILDSRNLQIKIDELINLLEQFNNLEAKDYKQNLNKIVERINSLKELIYKKEKV